MPHSTLQYFNWRIAIDRAYSSPYNLYIHYIAAKQQPRHILFSTFHILCQLLPHLQRKKSAQTTPTMTSSSNPNVHGLFHKDTSTMTYIISDSASKDTIILDSVLDYNASSGRTSNTHGEAIVEYCTANELNVKYILESHVHGKLLQQLF